MEQKERLDRPGNASPFSLGGQASLFEFERHLVTLELTAPVTFHFNHGGAIRGLLSSALGAHELPETFIPFCNESGRVEFSPADLYRFTVTLVGDSRALFDRFAESLSLVGSRTFSTSDARPTLGGNFRVVSIELLPRVDFSAEISVLQSRSRLAVRFVSPLRLQRPPQEKTPGKGFFNEEYFPASGFLQHLWKRLYRLGNGATVNRLERDKQCPSLPSNLSCANRHLLWLDVPIPTRGFDPKRPKGYTIGGVLGSVVLENIAQEWLLPLVVGQYLHVGEKATFGFGRYAIIEAGDSGTAALEPSRTALSRISDREVLEEALSHVLAHSEASGVDGVEPEDFALGSRSTLESLSCDLQNGHYEPADLLGFIVRQTSGSPRALAIPTVRDRVVQRAACQVLAPSIDRLLEDCSYAYRKGFSRAGAAAAIERAYAEGFRYVLEADISAFFDSVDWHRLFTKLDALFPSEPLAGLVKKWVQAAVWFAGKKIERTKGLPQGSAVSPLLANLFLDEFDEEILEKDYRLVRYADDFVILCKDLEATKTAKRAAEEALQKLGLSLNDEKTRIVGFDQGFTYLGYLFCRSVALEKAKDAPTSELKSLEHSIPPDSWLSHVPLDRVRAALAPRSSKLVRERHQPVWVPLPSEPEGSAEDKRPLYILGGHTDVRLQGEQLHISEAENTTQQMPVRSLSHVVLFGHTRVTVPVLLSLSRFGVPVYFCRRTGELYNVFTPFDPNWPLWSAQAAVSDPVKLRFAREIVAAKLHNSAALVVRFSFPDGGAVADELRELAHSCANKTTLEALLGVEGRAAALFFSTLKSALPSSWGFHGRRSHPPTDPINALLSLGYTVVYYHASTALIAAGLNPRIGLFHQQRGTYHALACDLQEEFRFLIDALVWSMVSRNEVKPPLGSYSGNERYSFVLDREAVHSFLAALEKRWMTEFTPANGDSLSYRAFLDRQARALRDLVLGRGTYSALRLRS